MKKLIFILILLSSCSSQFNGIKVKVKSTHYYHTLDKVKEDDIFKIPILSRDSIKLESGTLILKESKQTINIESK